MGQINPFTAAVAQSPAAVRQAAAERDAQLRKADVRQRGTGADAAHVDEFVETADAVESVGNHRPHEEPPPRQKQKRASPADPPASDEPHLDVQA
ncbi:MAG TPA: hypothetical protein VF624_15410 [Tepidisphaeraceae bacterium]|jgi:hypothetical protein